MIDAIQKIKAVLAEPLSVSDSMAQIIAFCKENNPQPEWDVFLRVAYEDRHHLQRWLQEVLTTEPMEEDIIGLWFGLFNPEYENGPTCDMYIGGSCSFSEEDIDWACDLDYWPQTGYAHSGVLAKIYELAHQTGLKNKAEYPLCLAYACFAIKDLLTHVPKERILENSHGIGVAVGFDDGDYLMLGEMSDKGLVLYP